MLWLFEPVQTEEIPPVETALDSADFLRDSFPSGRQDAGSNTQYTQDLR